MNELFFNILKKTEAYQNIKKELLNNPSHAYLYLTKDTEIAKAFFYLISLTKFCTNHSACMNCTECIKIKDNANPNVHFINSDGHKLYTQEVQDVIDGLYPPPLFGEIDLYFIQNFDEIDATAQNKLLKSLEEPPEHVIFFISASNEKRVLQTIRSRCRIINLDTFRESEITDFLLTCNVPYETARIAASFCDGQIQKAYDFAMDESFSNRFTFLKDMLLDIQSSKDIIKYSQNLYFKSNPKKTLDLLLFIFTIILDCHVDMNLLNNRLSQNVATTLIQKFSRKSLLAIIDHITDTLEELTYNVNESHAMDNLMFNIMEARYIWKS